MGTMGRRTFRSGNRPHRKTKQVLTDALVRTTEGQMLEALAVASAEPHEVHLRETAQELCDQYTVLCDARGVCRAVDCYKRTAMRYCHRHR